MAHFPCTLYFFNPSQHFVQVCFWWPPFCCCIYWVSVLFPLGIYMSYMYTLCFFSQIFSFGLHILLNYGCWARQWLIPQPSHSLDLSKTWCLVPLSFLLKIWDGMVEQSTRYKQQKGCTLWYKKQNQRGNLRITGAKMLKWINSGLPKRTSRFVTLMGEKEPWS